MNDAQRLFIAFHLPPVVRDYLMSLQRWFAQQLPNRPIRWVDPDNMHLTLRFMGETEVELIRPISAALTQIAAAHPSVTLTLSELGYFPKPNRPRVMWAGVDGDVPLLQALRKDVDLMLAQHQFARDGYRLKPHLTLGYFKQRDTKRPKQLPATLPLKPHTFTLTDFALVRSELLPAGPRYTDVATFRFAAA